MINVTETEKTFFIKGKKGKDTKGLKEIGKKNKQLHFLA